MRNRKKVIFIISALIILVASIFGFSNKKKINWTQLTSFRIYDYRTFPEGKNIRTYTEDDIEKMNFIETNIDSAKKMLLLANYLSNKHYLWKGHHFAIATFKDGQKRRLQISGYGGFFMDVTTGKYYEFSDEERKAWDKFWGDNYKELHKGK